jgi:hypothetical protein
VIVSVGIDNGLNGAVVAIDEDYNVLGWWDCPTIESTTKSAGKTKRHRDFAIPEMLKILQHIMDLVLAGRHVKVFLEYAQAMPKQGVTSTFKTGRGAGLWEGIVLGLGLPYDIVHPRTWTKVVLRDVPRGDPKHRSFIKCGRLYPKIPLKKPRGTKLTMDGRSDAALIATYGMLTMKGDSAPKKKRTPVKRKGS